MYYVLANFGGPRSLEEIRPFLEELLTDGDVIWPVLPAFLHKYLFRRIAAKRSLKIRHDYEIIGGKSPIYSDTEEIARRLSGKLGAEVIPFHRYLPATHRESLARIEAAGEVCVIPCFPQFSYATTGSIARFFSRRLAHPEKLRWIRSYPGHPAFISAHEEKLRAFLIEHQIAEEEALLLFSAHGLPRAFVDAGDAYESECQISYAQLQSRFPRAICRLSYQSKFGRGEWLRPYTDESCASVLSWSQGRKRAVVVPLSFTSDHIETLFEIERLYLPLLRERGLEAFRCPALGLGEHWLKALAEIARGEERVENGSLIRETGKR